MSERGWIDIAPASFQPRFQALRDSLAEAGCSAPAEFSACDAEAEIVDRLAAAKLSARSIRVAGQYGLAAASAADEFPALMLSLRSCDAFELSSGRWWPRNHLYEGLQRTAARDLRIVDLNGFVLVIGATAPARAAVAALAKVGFANFNVVDPDDAAASALIAEMSRGFYRARFESTAKKLVTQIAGIYGIVVNALETSDEELLEELTHMNFLRPGATWIELRPGPPNSPLLAEVVGAGAEVELGSRVLARADAAWAQAAWGVELQVEAHASRLQATVAAEQNAY